MLRRTIPAGFGLALLAAAGCGPAPKPLYQVRGQVFDSKKNPAVGALVTFHPTKADANDPARPNGTVDESGNFVLTTSVSGDGAPSGEYSITIVWPPARKTPFEPAGGDRLNGKLSRPENSPHKFTVATAPNQVVPAIVLP